MPFPNMPLGTPAAGGDLLQAYQQRTSAGLQAALRALRSRVGAGMGAGIGGSTAPLAQMSQAGSALGEIAYPGVGAVARSVAGRALPLIGGALGAYDIARAGAEGLRADQAAKQASDFAAANDPAQFEARGRAAGQRAAARTPAPGASPAPEAPPPAPEVPPTIEMDPQIITGSPSSYTVQAGDTLAGIAGAMLGPGASAQEIMALAQQLQSDIGLADPRKLQIGTRIPGGKAPMPRPKAKPTTGPYTDASFDQFQGNRRFQASEDLTPNSGMTPRFPRR